MSQCHLWTAIRRRRWGHWGRVVRWVLLRRAGLSPMRSSGGRGARWLVSVGMVLALVVRCLDLFRRGLGGEWEGGVLGGA